ncbi:YccT family protein [Thalassotalea sp. ND16A]|uniref:YccT family protein n=1 Tax=Thalassotalea sp. ND16A TaxID=1535422 RepID=UPI00051A4EE7|nr:DUF2057 domain-containing protein [Thalassotalea sp. ND16A]KGJ98759.1 hypothetical protein ND16A_0562 [Thalassotalea sp. ND16A]
MKSTLLPLLLGFSMFSVTAAELIVPEDFIVQRLNGEEYSRSIFSSETTLNIPEGQNILVLQYSSIFDDDMEDHHITVASKPFILLFTVGKEATLSFSYPEQLNQQDAKRFAKSPLVKLVKPDGDAVAVMIQSLASYNDTALKQSLLRRDEIAQQRSTQGEDGIISKTSPENLAMLKYWWQQASAKEQQEFLTFIKEQQKRN